MRCFAAAIVVLLLAMDAEGQEKYAIKLKAPSKGESIQVEKKGDQEGSMKIEIKDMAPTTHESKSSSHEKFVEAVLERPKDGGLPTKAKRIYEMAIVDQKAPGALPNQQIPKPYHGKSVLIEKKDNDYEFRIEGGDVVNGDIDELKAEFRGEKSTQEKLLPNRPVAVGESYVVTGKDILGVANQSSVLAFHLAKEECKAKVVRTFKKDGAVWGVIEGDVEAEFLMGNGKPGDGSAGTGKIVGKITFEGCIDGTKAEGELRITGQMELSLILSAEGMGSVAKCSGISKVTETWTWKEVGQK